jgi:integrase/recombinase XerD
MERHPYIVTMHAYLDGIRSTVGQATLRERESKLLYLFEVMLELRLSTDPRTMDKEEIDALVLWMRERNLGLAYQAKLWQYLRGLFAFVGNNILDVMKARGQWRPPKRAYRPVTVKDDSWFSATVARLANETGWRPRMVLSATAIYYHTGLRPKELRLAALRDFDLGRWSLTVQHPKGEGTWAVEGETVRLFPNVRPFVLDYLDNRLARLHELGLDPASTEPLFPNENGGYYSEPGWRMARYKVFRSFGIEANYKVLRASFAQKLKDHGAPIENVSAALRHKTVATTEQFYARVRTERAWDALEEIWSKPELRIERK